MSEQRRLTEMVACAGWASKLPPGTLSQVVRHLAELFPATAYPEVLVGLGEPDDAAIYRLDESRALIKTTDFFTPVVDDPWTYGAIAAVNAMSDVYAMGGEVILCLNIAGFPEALGSAVVAQIFAGGAHKVKEAGAAIAGGHTVTSPEPFYGLSVTGLVHPDQVMRKGGARIGDRLFLTKPLGTGIITTAAKLSLATDRPPEQPPIDPLHLEAAILSMLRLNRAAARAARAAQVTVATDITGFGLLGHSVEMAMAGSSRTPVTLRIHSQAVPTLPGALLYAAAGYLTRGSRRNPEHFGAQVQFAEGVSATQRHLLWEAETSGGLLLAVLPNQVETLRAACSAAGQPCWEIGEVAAGRAGVEVV